METQKIVIPKQKHKKCRTTTRSGCTGYVVAWSEWKDNGFGFMYRTPSDVRCSRCGHTALSYEDKEDWLFTTDAIGQPFTGDGHIPSMSETPWMYDMAILA